MKNNPNNIRVFKDILIDLIIKSIKSNKKFSNIKYINLYDKNFCNY